MSDLFARYDIWLLMSISDKDEGSGLADIFALCAMPPNISLEYK
jgi:hypothetical protein